MANKNLGKAKTEKNDEFYTQYADIQQEMNAYIEYDPDVFRDKIILLPCDDPEWSNFTKFFAQNFEQYGIKKLISTSYAPESKKIKAWQPTLFETENPHFDADKSKTHGKIFVLDKDTNGNGKIDIEDLQWDYLEGDGDFRSAEVCALRDEADIIITNPPFSLFKEFMIWIVESGKKFAFICNKNSVTYKEVFPLVKANLLWSGVTPWAGGMWFETTNLEDVDKYIEGKPFKNIPAIWMGNIDHGRRHTPLDLMTMEDNIMFSKHKEIKGKGYIHYENYDAIEVPYYDAIPVDYEGIMGVPRSFLDKYCPEQFEIIGIDSTDFSEELGIEPIGEEWVRNYKASGGTGHMTANMRNLVLYSNGIPKISFARILIRKRKQQ